MEKKGERNGMVCAMSCTAWFIGDDIMYHMVSLVLGKVQGYRRVHLMAKA
jgi:hypothetical protein